MKPSEGEAPQMQGQNNEVTSWAEVKWEPRIDCWIIIQEIDYDLDKGGFDEVAMTNAYGIQCKGRGAQWDACSMVKRFTILIVIMLQSGHTAYFHIARLQISQWSW